MKFCIYTFVIKVIYQPMKLSYCYTRPHATKILIAGATDYYVVTLRYARLVPGWVTVFGRVNHLGAEPGTQAYSA